MMFACMCHKFPYIVLPFMSLCFTGIAIEVLPISDGGTIIALSFQAFFVSLAGIWIKLLYTQAKADALTGLDNRRQFQFQLNLACKKARRSKEKSCLALIDVDNFKDINDTYGHMVGDKVLRHLSCIFQNSTRKGDLIARLGGDEFAIIFPDTEPSEALNAVERIRQETETKSGNFHVTLSIGLSSLSKTLSPEEVLDRADKALYIAKQSKNKISIADNPAEPTTPQSNTVLAS